MAVWVEIVMEITCKLMLAYYNQCLNYATLGKQPLLNCLLNCIDPILNHIIE